MRLKAVHKEGKGGNEAGTEIEGGQEFFDHVFDDKNFGSYSEQLELLSAEQQDAIRAIFAQYGDGIEDLHNQSACQLWLSEVDPDDLFAAALLSLVDHAMGVWVDQEYDSICTPSHHDPKEGRNVERANAGVLLRATLLIRVLPCLVEVEGVEELNHATIRRGNESHIFDVLQVGDGVRISALACVGVLGLADGLG